MDNYTFKMDYNCLENNQLFQLCQMLEEFILGKSLINLNNKIVAYKMLNYHEEDWE